MAKEITVFDQQLVILFAAYDIAGPAHTEAECFDELAKIACATLPDKKPDDVVTADEARKLSRLIFKRAFEILGTET